VTAVTELHLGGLGAHGAGNQLVAQTDTEDGYAGVLKHLGEVLGGGSQGGRVTGTVGHEETIVVLTSEGGEVVIPRNDQDLHTAGQKATQLVVLHTDIQAEHTHSTAGGVLEGDIGGGSEEAGFTDGD
jgi:hypothetical protein